MPFRITARESIITTAFVFFPASPLTQSRPQAKGTATASFLQRHLDGQVLTPEETQTIKWVSTMLYLGGEDTVSPNWACSFLPWRTSVSTSRKPLLIYHFFQTKSALMTFFLCLLLNPEAQKRAQAELDLVLGTEDGSGLERLVTGSDRSRLPYVDACWRESMRWHPVAPQGLVHEVGADDVLDHKGRQYAIPKGTYVMTNIWYVLAQPISALVIMLINILTFAGLSLGILLHTSTRIHSGQNDT
jgi:hypothetical protein